MDLLDTIDPLIPEQAQEPVQDVPEQVQQEQPQQPELITTNEAGTFVPEEALQEQQIDAAQQPLLDTFTQSFAPAVQSVKRRIDDEGILGLFNTPTDPTYNREEHRERLLKDIPLSLQDNILEEGNLAAAERTRARILADQERGQRLLQQRGVSPVLAQLAGGVIDIDLPLALVSGGGYKAAQLSRKALQIGKAAGLSPKAATALSSGVVGANAGLQGGLLAGAAEVATRDTAEWTLVAEAALTGALAGGVLNPLVRGDTQLAVANAKKQINEQLEADELLLRNKDHDNLTKLKESELNELEAQKEQLSAEDRSLVEEAINNNKTKQEVVVDNKKIDRVKQNIKSIQESPDYDELLGTISKLDLETRNLKIVGAGLHKLVFSDGNQVVRVFKGKPETFPIDDHVLRPTNYGRVGEFHVQVMPLAKELGIIDKLRLQRTNGDQDKLKKVIGFGNDTVFEDPHLGNVRKLGDKLVIIDGAKRVKGKISTPEPTDGLSPSLKKLNEEGVLEVQAPLVFKNNLEDEIGKARKELHDHIRLNSPSLTNDVDLDVSSARANSIIPDEPSISVDEVNSTAGAASVEPLQGTQRTILNDPAGEVSPRISKLIDRFSEWRNDSGWLDTKNEVSDEFWTKVALSDVANLTTSEYRKLYTSNSAGLNWLAGNVFESPNGLGRGKYTAAAGMEFYHRNIVKPITRTVQSEAFKWAKANDATFKGTGYGITKQGSRQFNREILLELNARKLGTSHSTDPSVLRSADAYSEAGSTALRIGKGDEGQHSIDGFEKLDPKEGYSPQIWEGRQILDLEKSGVVKRQSIIDALTNGYRNAGISSSKDASKIAKAVIQRAIAKDVEDVDTNLAALLSSDGREFLRDSLLRDGVSEKETDNIIERITGNLEERGKEGFAKSRNEIDLSQKIETSDGSDVRIVDLLNQDLTTTWQRYARRVSGSAALARVGITNKAQREEIITAIQVEQRSLGEEVIDGDQLRAMFSNFNGGPVHGFFRGTLNEGVGAEIAIAKRLTNLALLGKLGLAQLAETGTIIAQQGFTNWVRRGPMALFDKELKSGNKQLLDDMSYLLGDLGQDHKHFAEWLDLDDISSTDRNDWISAVSKFTSKAQYIQGYTSIFNQVRGFQQKTAAMGMVDKVFRTVKQSMEQGDEISAQTMRRFREDLGLDEVDMRELEHIISSGKVEFGSRGDQIFVNRLHFDQWDTEFSEIFASAITRNTNQVVQKSMAGEQDSWMNTQWGSVMTHLKSFPLQAIQKQFIRNLRHSDPQTLATVLMGFGTAGVAMMIRDAIDGRERTNTELAKAAFSYSNTLGWVPMFVDPTLTLLGLEDYRINAYGPHSEYTPPIITQLNRTARLPGAIADTLTGNDDWYDRQSLKALPFANTLGLQRMFE